MARLKGHPTAEPDDERPGPFRYWEWATPDDPVTHFADEDGNLTAPALRALRRWLDARHAWAERHGEL